MSANPSGLCMCGCGQPTQLARMNDRSKGWIKGEPLKLIKGHAIKGDQNGKSLSSRGNRTMSSHGYVVVRIGSKQRKYEHVLVAELALGRELVNHGRGHPESEVVHHINGVKTDNRPENLLICSHEYHVALHHRLAASADWPEFAPVTRRGFGAERHAQ